MFRHIWSVLCLNASIDQRTNSASLLNILETIYVNKPPTQENPAPLALASLVSLWTREDISTNSEGKMRAYVIDPNGQELTSPIELDIILENDIYNHRTRIDIQMMPLPFIGQYNFHIEYMRTLDEEWQTAAIVPLLLKLEDS